MVDTFKNAKREAPSQGKVRLLLYRQIYNLRLWEHGIGLRGACWARKRRGERIWSSKENATTLATCALPLWNDLLSVLKHGQERLPALIFNRAHENETAAAGNASQLQRCQLCVLRLPLHFISQHSYWRVEP